MMQSAQTTPYQSAEYGASGYDNTSSPYGAPSAADNHQTYAIPSAPEPSPHPYNSAVGSPHQGGGLGLWGNTQQMDRRQAPSSHPTSTPYEGQNFSFSEESAGVPAWGGNQATHLKVSQAQQQMTPRTLSAPPDCFAYAPPPASPWNQTKPEDSIDLDNFVAGLHGGSPSFTMNNNENIVDLRIPITGLDDHPREGHANHGRHFSASSSSVSSNGPVGDNLAFEEFSSTYNTTPDPSDFQSRESLSMPATSMAASVSPNPSYPHSSPQGVIRGRQGSHGRASSTPHASLPSTNARFAPYSVEQRRPRNWSASSVTAAPSSSSASSSSRQWSPLLYKRQQRFTPQGLWDSPYQSPPPPPIPDQAYGYAQVQPPHAAYQPTPAPMPPYANGGGVGPSASYTSGGSQYDNPPPLMSHGLFRMLQSNADPISHQHYRYADLSDPPDLFASLQEKQLAPPEEDMNPSDPDLVPHEQDLRFDGDLYTPQWVRGHGNKREGWCGICKPGRWLVLKNSAFWYDKSFSHGVSAATGAQFHEPQDTRRMDGNPDVWEGMCGSCHEWVALVSSKKKGTTWFRHAYKCHTHLKVKDAPKRKRESSHTRSLTGGSGSKPHSASPSPPRSVPVQPTPQQQQQHSQTLQHKGHSQQQPQQQQHHQHQHSHLPQHHQQYQPQHHASLPSLQQQQQQSHHQLPPHAAPLATLEQLGTII